MPFENIVGKEEIAYNHMVFSLSHNVFYLVCELQFYVLSST